jgi:hypothetical protein
MSALADLIANGFGISSVRGLTGKNVAAASATKFSLLADAVTLRDPVSGQTITKYQPGELIADVSLAGPVAGGRDQAAVISATSFVSLFYIYNPTSRVLALIFSSSSTAPTLPDGFTHFCYATTIRGASALTAMQVIGARAYYSLSSDSMRVLNNGGATAATAVSCAQYTPPNSLRTILQCMLQMSSSSIGSYGLGITGIGNQYVIVVQFVINVVSTSQAGTSQIEIPLDGQSFQYRVSVGASGGAYIDVLGYVVANGDN